jgi:hypothetical protein
MKRRLQFAVLVLLPLLVMQSASASVACSALRSSCSRCSDNGSNSGQDCRCPGTQSLTPASQNACCQVGSPKPAQQVRTNPSGVQQDIPYGTTGQFIERIPFGLQLNPTQTIPSRNNSLQSLLCIFLT